MALRPVRRPCGPRPLVRVPDRTRRSGRESPAAVDGDPEPRIGGGRQHTVRAARFVPSSSARLRSRSWAWPGARSRANGSPSSQPPSPRSTRGSGNTSENSFQKSFSCPSIALVLLLAYWYHERPSMRRIVLLSAVCALLSLARPEQLALFVLLVVPLVLLTRTLAWKRRIGWLAASAAVALLLFAPWAIFNATRFKEPVLLSTGLGATMASGACDAVFSGDLLGHYDQRPLSEQQADSGACVYPHFGELASLDRSEADLRMRRIALRYTRRHLSQLPKVIVAREGRTFSLYRPFQEVQLASAWSKSPTWVGYLWTAMYWVLAPFALAGAVLLKRRRVLLYPLLVEFVIVAISAATTFGLIRYRAAAEVPLLILSAVALDRVWKWWSTRSSVSEARVEPDPRGRGDARGLVAAQVFAGLRRRARQSGRTSRHRGPNEGEPCPKPSSLPHLAHRSVVPTRGRWSTSAPTTWRPSC